MTDPLIQLWVELRFASAPMTMSDMALAVCARANIRARTLCAAIDAWTAAGLVVGSGQPVAYVMTDGAKRQASPPVAPLASDAAPRPWTPRRTPRQRLWTAMRVLKRFDMQQLAMTADVAESTAKGFLRTMARAGYVRRIEGSEHWVLGSRVAGPLPPVVRNVRIDGRPFERVIDRNDSQVTDTPVRPHRQDRFFLTEGLNHD